MKILQYPGVRTSACKTCYYKGITLNKIYSFSKLLSSKKGSAMTESYQEILQLFHMKLRAETGAKTCKKLFVFFFENYRSARDGGDTIKANMSESEPGFVEKTEKKKAIMLFFILCQWTGKGKQCIPRPRPIEK